MIFLSLFAGLIGLTICLTDWRKGLFVCTAVGFLQDPIRKMMAGEPVVMTVMVGLFLLITIFSALAHGETLSFEPVLGRRDTVRAPLALFVMLVLVQAGLTAIRYGNLVLAAIGAVSYLAPLPALLLAYYYPRSVDAITRFVAFYIAMTSAAALGVYLAFLGYDVPGLAQVGEGLRIYDMGMVLEAFPGFMRSPEVMAWHIAAAVCLSIVILTLTERTGIRLLTCGLVLFLVLAGFLTGRRKMLVEIMLFLTFFGFLFFYFQPDGRRSFAFSLLAGGGGICAMANMLLPSEVVWQFNPYWQRGITAFADAPERFTKLGLGSVGWALNRAGIFGKGAGTGSQGAQHFGGGTLLVGGAGEGGLGKIMVELGVPGLLLTVWLSVALALYSWHLLKPLQQERSKSAIWAYGLIAFLAANVPVFMSASQVYGDPFVLLVLGWLLGLFLAVPTWGSLRGEEGILDPGHPVSPIMVKARGS